MHWLRYLMSLLLIGDVVIPARRRHSLNLALLEKPARSRDTAAYAAADQHPELRTPARLADDDQTEFVRREWTETVYKKVRTYSEFTNVSYNFGTTVHM